MLDAIRQIREYTTDLSFEDFRSTRVVVDAVLYRFSIIGEAANAIPAEVRESHAHLPWNAIRGMRNRLIHEYFGVRLETVWETIAKELPELEEQLSDISKRHLD